MKKLKWNPEIFVEEYGPLTNKAFEVLNDTFGRYGYNDLLRKGVNLVSKYFEIKDDDMCGINPDKYINTVGDLINDMEQTYYKILQYRKQKDMEFKINAIEKDF
jgi:hypothetical protein